MIAELDQIIALSIILAAFPGAVVTFSQGLNQGQYLAFAQNLHQDIILQQASQIAESANMSNYQLNGMLSSSLEENYTISASQADIKNGSESGVINRVLVSKGNAYQISVNSNESSDLD